MSARGNALALDSPLTPVSLLRCLNGISPDLFFTDLAPISPEFRVRAALRRRYRFFDRTSPSRLERWKSAARSFVGEIDVRSLGRALPSERPVLRTVESLEVEVSNGGLVVEVAARSFVWGMVRKIVGALREVDAGRLSVGRLEDALRGRVRLTLPMAEPEPLVLWDVEFAVPWAYHWSGPNRHQQRWWDDTQRGLAQRAEVLAAIGESADLPGSWARGGSATRPAPTVRASGRS